MQIQSSAIKKMITITLSVILLSIVIAVTANNQWSLRRNKYNLLWRIRHPPTIKEIQAKHDLQRLRLIRGEPLEGKEEAPKYIRQHKKKNFN